MLADAQQSCYVHQQMDAYKSGCIAQACGAQVASETSSAEVSPPPQYQQIKLALDVHAASIVAVRMVDGAKPQPPQSFKPAAFLKWAGKQKALAQGIRNYVVCPTCLDERHGGVNNDRTDALELATRLDRYLAGNDRALAVVRVPTEAEEQKRAHKRQRQQLREQRLSLAAQGR